MKIKVFGQYEFTDFSDSCYENGDLSIEYDVPKSWKKWDEEKRQIWLQKNESKITRKFEEAMCVVHHMGLYEDIESED